MEYKYECRDSKCKSKEVAVIITKPMLEYDKPEYCSECDNVMYRIYTAPAVSTSDGFKK